MSEKKPADTKKKAVIMAVVMFGLISCFGDIMYEGARSANGQYFELLAINATTVGVVYGIGEFLGYALRLISGRISDKTGKHWILIFLGYGSLIVVPLMGFTKSIPVLFTLFLLERVGKALRNPPKDTILSQVAENSVGTGIVFGIQEALDQLGAFIGPMVFTLTFMTLGREDIAAYQTGYKVLIFAYVLVMAAVYIAYKKISQYDLVREGETIDRGSDTLTPVFWIYCLFTFLATMGLVAYTIIGYHLKDAAILSDKNITSFYSIAMIVDAIIAVIVGKLYDDLKKKQGNKQAGLLVLIFIPLCTVLVPFLALGNNIWAVVAGIMMYGVVLGGHETVMRSAIADLTSFKKRGTAYGIFNSIYGLALLIGSALIGYLYDHATISAICIFCVVCEILAVATFFMIKKKIAE
ncbi:MAG: MFS transporter [Erysipelotrichaceae bacterium]|nr:MFS transporter [Erysipelotrichaceae bacterium]